LVAIRAESTALATESVLYRYTAQHDDRHVVRLADASLTVSLIVVWAVSNSRPSPAFSVANSMKGLAL
jgi:hypothetical protein